VIAFFESFRFASRLHGFEKCIDRECQASIVAQIHLYPVALGLAVHSFTRPLSELYGFCKSLEGTAAGLAARNADLSEIRHLVPGFAGARSARALVVRGKASFRLFGKVSDCSESESSESLISAEQEEH